MNTEFVLKNDKCRKQLLHSWRFGNQVPSQSSSSWAQASHYKPCLSWWPHHSSSPLACSCCSPLLSRSHQPSEREANPISVCRRCRRHHMVSVTNSVYNHTVVLTSDMKLRRKSIVIHHGVTPWQHAHRAVHVRHCLLEVWSEEVAGKMWEVRVGLAFGFLPLFNLLLLPMTVSCYRNHILHYN